MRKCKTTLLRPQVVLRNLVCDMTEAYTIISAAAVFSYTSVL